MTNYQPYYQKNHVFYILFYPAWLTARTADRKPLSQSRSTIPIPLHSPLSFRLHSDSFVAQHRDFLTLPSFPKLTGALPGPVILRVYGASYFGNEGRRREGIRAFLLEAIIGFIWDQVVAQHRGRGRPRSSRPESRAPERI